MGIGVRKPGLLDPVTLNYAAQIRNVHRISNEAKTGRRIGIQAINDKVSDLGRMTTGISFVWRVGT
jgi:hypothetical protein